MTELTTSNHSQLPTAKWEVVGNWEWLGVAVGTWELR